MNGSGTELTIRTEGNKVIAKAFYDLIFNQCRPREAIEWYVGARYIQHNPAVADEKEEFIAYFERMAEEFPGKRVHFLRAFFCRGYDELRHFLRSRTRHKQHIPARRRRLFHLRRATTALAIREAA